METKELRDFIRSNEMRYLVVDRDEIKEKFM
jgi:hypothetical protein